METNNKKAGRPFGAQTGIVRWTNSSWQSFKECPAKFNLSYEMGIRPKTTPLYFRIGDAAHRVLASFYLNPRGDTALMIEKACAAFLEGQKEEKERFTAWMTAYFELNPFPITENDVFLCEKSLIATLPGDFLPGQTIHKIEVAGKLDVIGFQYAEPLDQYRLLICDHKSSSKKPAPTDRAWNPQLYTYRLLWNVVMKDPSKVVTYDGKPFTGFVKQFQKIMDKTGNLSEPCLQNNVLVKSTAKKPEYTQEHFQLVEVPEFHYKLEEMILPNMIEDAKKMRAYRQSKTWPKNPHHCIDVSGGWSKKCDYWQFCVQGDESGYENRNPWEELEK